MYKFVAYPFFAASLLIQAGCTSIAPPLDIQSPEKAMVFGHIEADVKIDRVDFHEFGEFYMPPFKYPPRVLVFDNGDYMVENLKPGKYILAGFHSENKNYTVVNSDQKAYQRIIHVKPGGLHYVGAHRIVVTKSLLLGHGDFRIDDLVRPDERVVLKHMFEVTQGTGWQKKIDRRLKELRQN